MIKNRLEYKIQSMKYIFIAFLFTTIIGDVIYIDNKIYNLPDSNVDKVDFTKLGAFPKHQLLNEFTKYADNFMSEEVSKCESKKAYNLPYIHVIRLRMNIYSKIFLNIDDYHTRRHISQKLQNQLL